MSKLFHKLCGVLLGKALRATCIIIVSGLPPERASSPKQGLIPEIARLHKPQENSVAAKLPWTMDKWDLYEPCGTERGA